MLLGIGLVAYVLEKLDYPSAPIVLGVILGPLAESQLRLALTISGGNAVAITSSLISMILIALTLFVLVAPLWRAWQDSRKTATA